MYYSFGRVTGVQGDDLLSTEGNITNIPGQSGSPLWSTGNNVIYAVNSAWSNSTASNAPDYFARITPSVFNELQSWRNSDRAPTATAASMAFSPVGAGGLTSATAGMARTDGEEGGGSASADVTAAPPSAGAAPNFAAPPAGLQGAPVGTAQGADHPADLPGAANSPPDTSAGVSRFVDALTRGVGSTAAGAPGGADIWAAVFADGGASLLER
jgi:hypothetical protein